MTELVHRYGREQERQVHPIVAVVILSQRVDSMGPSLVAVAS
jgi:hypothetical protein